MTGTSHRDEGGDAFEAMRAELVEVEGWLWDIEAMRAAGVSPAAIETARGDVLARREELCQQIREADHD